MSCRTLRQLRQIPALHVVVRLEEDLAQPRLADRVVLEIEFVEAMERVLMCVHIERVDGEVVRGQIERLENLRESEVLAVAEDDNVLRSQRGDDTADERQDCASS